MSLGQRKILVQGRMERGHAADSSDDYGRFRRVGAIAAARQRRLHGKQGKLVVFVTVVLGRSKKSRERGATIIP